MFQLIRNFLTAATGGGSKLAPVAPPKVKPKQQAYPGFITSTRPSDAVLPKVDPQLANLDITTTYRLGRSTSEIIRNLARANPDLSAATSAYLRIGIPERYIVLARDPDGTVNDEATLLCYEVAQRFDKPGYDTGFSQVDSLRSVSESLAKEGLFYGGMSCELVLDKGRLPFKLQPVHVPSVKFYEDNSGGTKGLRPVQDVGGTEIDLDIATFFMVWLDPNLLDPYTQSPFDAAIQPVLLSSQFLADLRRVLQRHVYPRYDVKIDEEKLRTNIPQETLMDSDLLAVYLNDRIAEVETAINELGPEEALIHYDWIEIEYIKNDDGQGTAEKFEVIKTIIDANLAKSAKVMPSVLGNGAGSQNIASTETMMFLMQANGLIRMKLQEMYSRIFTLCCRLYGLDVTADFEYDEIDLRPAKELEAFKTMRAERLRRDWLTGTIGDMEYCLRTTGKPPPKGFKSLSGTYIDPVAQASPMADTDDNAYSGTGNGGGQSGGGAATQSRKTGTPSKSKGPPK